MSVRTLALKNGKLCIRCSLNVDEFNIHFNHIDGWYHMMHKLQFIIQPPYNPNPSIITHTPDGKKYVFDRNTSYLLEKNQWIQARMVWNSLIRQGFKRVK
jgi:hypothetical protein